MGYMFNNLGFNIPVIEGGFGENQKVILAKTIAEIHEMPLKKVNQLINENIKEFENGIDIIDLKSEYLESIEFLNDIFNKQSIANSNNIYLLSEQGYMILVGFMKTKKAKELRKMLRREYFAMRVIIKSDEQLKAMAEIHEMSLKKVNQLINENIEEFEFGIDILDLKTGDYQAPVLQNGLFTNAQWGNSNNIYFLSELSKILII